MHPSSTASTARFWNELRPVDLEQSNVKVRSACRAECSATLITVAQVSVLQYEVEWSLCVTGSDVLPLLSIHCTQRNIHSTILSICLDSSVLCLIYILFFYTFYIHLYTFYFITSILLFCYYYFSLPWGVQIVLPLIEPLYLMGTSGLTLVKTVMYDALYSRYLHNAL